MDWSSASFLDAIIARVNQRIAALPSGVLMALGLEPLPTVSVGDDVSNSLIFYKLQTAILAMATGAYCAEPSGEISSQPVPFTEAEWALAAGLTAGGFRRTSVHPSDPSFTGFIVGRCSPGDIIGEWIFDDLASGANALTCFTSEPAFVSGESVLRSGDGMATIPEAIASCESATEDVLPCGDSPAKAESTVVDQLGYYFAFQEKVYIEIRHAPPGESVPVIYDLWGKGEAIGEFQGEIFTGLAEGVWAKIGASINGGDTFTITPSGWSAWGEGEGIREVKVTGLFCIVKPQFTP